MEKRMRKKNSSWLMLSERLFFPAFGLDLKHQLFVDIEPDGFFKKMVG